MTEPVVALYPADETGCGNHRIIWPAAALTAQGAAIEVYPPGHPKRLTAWQRRCIESSCPVSTAMYQRAYLDAQTEAAELSQAHGTSVTPRKITEHAIAHNHVEKVLVPDADVLVFQRPLNLVFVEAMEILAQAGKHIVIELDDDFERVSPNNGAYAAVHPALSPTSNWAFLRRALKVADRLVVSTKALARYGSAELPVHVVENRIPARYLDIAHDPTRARLGWAGAVQTHPNDLQQLGGSVASALRRVPAEGHEQGQFHVVGPVDKVAEALSLPDEQIHATGWILPIEYAEAVATEITVGVAPLDNTTFNHAKSWLKPLEFASLGIPPIMSDLPEYRSLADLGIGQIARKPAHWTRSMIGLLDDEARRIDEGAKARDLVASEGLTIEAQCDHWWDAWTGGL